MYLYCNDTFHKDGLNFVSYEKLFLKQLCAFSFLELKKHKNTKIKKFRPDRLDFQLSLSLTIF